MRVSLGHVEVLSRDVAAAERFYVDGLGFEVAERQGPSIVWLRAGAASVLLRPGRPGPRAEGYAASGAAMVVYTDDLPATLRGSRARASRPAARTAGRSVRWCAIPTGTGSSSWTRAPTADRGAARRRTGLAYRRIGSASRSGSGAGRSRGRTEDP